jgi:hypothetical protein
MSSQTALVEICSCYVHQNLRKSQSAGAAPRAPAAKNAEAIITTRGIIESYFFRKDDQPGADDGNLYLDTLNPEQRRAVEHGAAGPGPCAPLLVIAGAGSGKTNKMANRVAHLIVEGADPRRIFGLNEHE